MSEGVAGGVPAHLLTLVADSALPTFVAGPDGLVEAANRALVHLLGERDATDLVGRPWRSFVAELDGGLHLTGHGDLVLDAPFDLPGGRRRMRLWLRPAGDDGRRIGTLLEVPSQESRTRSVPPLLDALPAPALLLDRDGAILVANAAAAQVTGRPPEALVELPAGDVMEAPPFAGLRWHRSVVADGQGTVLAVGWPSAGAESMRLRQVLDAVPVAVAVCEDPGDGALSVRQTNARWRRLADSVGVAQADLTVVRERGLLAHAVRSVLVAGGRDELVCTLADGSGSVRVGVDALDGQHVALTLTPLDEAAASSGGHDALTGLWNGELVADQLVGALARAARTGGLVAVLLADVDRLGSVNAEHGTAAGDAVLAELSARVRRAVRPQDTVARRAGDELAIIAEDLADETGAGVIVARLHAVTADPIDLPGGGITRVSFSVGGVVASGATDPGAVLSAASAALVRAKQVAPGGTEVTLLLP